MRRVPTGSIGRRSLFGRSALAGGAALALAQGGAGARAVAAEASAGFRLFAAPDMKFEALFALGGVRSFVAMRPVKINYYRSDETFQRQDNLNAALDYEVNSTGSAAPPFSVA